MKRFWRPILNTAMVGGLILAVWPLGQTLFGRWSQRSLAAQWQQEKAPNPRPNPRMTAPKPSKIGAKIGATTAATPKRALQKAAWPLTKLSIPSIDLETFVVADMDNTSLRRGPGHDPQSSLPGAGNCVIAGHRNIYGSPFYRLDELMAGAEIRLETRDQTYFYAVSNVFATPDTNLSVTAPPPPGTPPVLTLVTCTLPHTSNRIVVTAILQE